MSNKHKHDVTNESLKELIFEVYIKKEVEKQLKEIIYLIDNYSHVMGLEGLKKQIERKILEL